MFQFITASALKKNPNLKDLDKNKECFFLLENANNKQFNEIKLALTPVLYISKVEKNKYKSNWIGTNFDYTNNLKRLEKQSFKIISFHTDDTLYTQAAERLKQSLEYLKIEYVIEKKKNLGNWEKNCAQKPLFIYEQWKKSDKPVVWVDCDAIINQYPILFDYLKDIDFAIHKKEHHEFLSGTIYFNKTQATENLLKLWIQKCKQNYKIVDQIQLDFAWHEIQKKENFTTLWLPQAYTKIYDIQDDISPIIEHFQASRGAVEPHGKIKYIRLRRYQKKLRKLDLPPPNLSLLDKLLDWQRRTKKRIFKA